MHTSTAVERGPGIITCVAIGVLCVVVPGAWDVFLYAVCIVTIIVVFLAAGSRIMAAIRPFSSVPIDRDDSYRPKVSVLVTSKDEPASIVIKSIAALTKLDYPNYEVIVINSNNSDQDNYERIAHYVASCPDNFRFVHVDKIHGFKAGALNYLNRHCISDDSVIEAVVDCDYIVDPNFLNRTVGYFRDKRVGLVQAPQDYSCVDGQNVGLYYEYRSFFSMIMHQAQRLGLVSFTGTMGLVRTSLMRQGIGWDESCITEDAEAGMRISREGYMGVYVDENLGKGYMPFDYDNLIRQRRRWVYGNMQVLSQNIAKVFHERGLDLRQKAAFLAQTMAWFQPELVVSVISVVSLLSWHATGSYLFEVLGTAMLNLLAVCLTTSLVTFLVGLRRDAALADRVKALLVHYGLLSVMSTAWLLWPLGYRMGFAVTRKVPDQNGHARVPISQMVLILLLVACVLLMPHEAPFIWGGVASGFTAVLVLVSTLYTNWMFSQAKLTSVQASVESARRLATQENGDPE